MLAPSRKHGRQAEVIGKEFQRPLCQPQERSGRVVGVGCLHPPPGQQRSPSQMHPANRFMTFHAVRQKRSESKELGANEDV